MVGVRAVLCLTIVLAAAAASPAAEAVLPGFKSLVPWGAANWKARAVAHDACDGFGLVGYGPDGGCGLLPSTAPFGNAAPSCPGLALAAPLTDFPANGDIIAQRTINIPAGHPWVRMDYVADNDIMVFLNGVLVGHGEHGFCDLRGAFTFTLGQFRPGANTLSVRVVDFGALAYFDARLLAQTPTEPESPVWVSPALVQSDPQRWVREHQDWLLQSPGF